MLAAPAVSVTSRPYSPPDPLTRQTGTGLFAGVLMLALVVTLLAVSLRWAIRDAWSWRRQSRELFRQVEDARR